MVPRYPDFFNDVFGPVMQPGSSSHQAGPCRIAFLTSSLLGHRVRSVEFVLDPAGSFAGTFGLMNEDTALVAGILGMGPADTRFFDAKSIAAERGLVWSFSFSPIAECDHPNAVKIIASDGRRNVSLIGASTGGGMVEIVSVQGYPVSFIGDSFVTFLWGENDHGPEGSFAEGTVYSADGAMRWFATVSVPREVSADALVMSPILPVLAHPDRRPQLFRSMAEWRRLAESSGSGLYEIAIAYEEASSLWPRDRIVAEMRAVAALLADEVAIAYSALGAEESRPDARRDDRLWVPYVARGGPIAGSTLAHALKLALGVNAKVRGVPIVPGPMGTGGGYLYSALYAVKEARGASDEAVLRGLFVASGVGAIAYTRTNPTGEAIGCAGECGVCSAMASAAIVEMLGGTPEQAEHAASFAIQAAIGLPCDPIPGGREQPCLSRIVSAVGNAILFADLALAGSDAVLPFHEALDAADEVGRALSPDLKCTARGGCCATPTGKRLAGAFRKGREA